MLEGECRLQASTYYTYILYSKIQIHIRTCDEEFDQYYISENTAVRAIWKR